jgi:NADH-quinone oxidoreductase subunit H
LPHDSLSAGSGLNSVNETAAHSILLVSLIKVVVLLFLVLTAVAYLVWFERKVAAHLQGRWGPYRVGPHGLLQPLADGVKFLLKEDVAPAGADRFLYFAAPLLTMTLAISTIAMIPFGPASIHILGVATPLVVANINVGLLAIFAITSIGVYGVALAGWSSNSKYSLLGGLRSSAQMISYELSLTLSVIGVLLLAGTFNLSELIMRQDGYTWGFVPKWNLLNPTLPQILGFFCYFVSAVAETNRAPFDLAEAESEIVAGYHTEYSSFKFAMFFLGEYASMITVACLASILFLGGWLSPFPQTPGLDWIRYLPAAALAVAGVALILHGVNYLTVFGRIVLTALGVALCALSFLCSRPGVIEDVQGPFWFLAKVLVVLFVYVWVRWTLPRFRYDQLMRFGWKVLFPVALLNVVVTSFAVVMRQ